MDRAEIDIRQTVYKLCSSHEGLAEALVEAGFKDITNPLMMNTAGRFMTLEKGSQHKKISLEHISEVLERHGFTLKKD